MPGVCSPEEILHQLEKGRLLPFYLFYGESEFLLERVLNSIRRTFIPESVKDFNLRIFYGDDTPFNAGEVLDTARSFPFMSENRLVIVRRTEKIAYALLEGFIPYLNDPMDTTCLIFVSTKPDFRKKFYKTIKNAGGAVDFKPLFDNQVVPWIKKMAKEMGLDIDSRACSYLQLVVGNRMRDLYTELEKIHLCYGNKTVGLDEAKKIVIYSRSHTIFELMDHVSNKKRAEAISVLKRYIEEEGREKETVIKTLGMFIRQIKLLWQAKSITQRGGRAADLSKELRLHIFPAKKLVQQVKAWTPDEFERAFDLLYQADGLVKTGSEGHLVLENAVLSLCE